jgi:hypothetical protein
VELRFPESDQRVAIEADPEPRGRGLVYLPFPHRFPVWPPEKQRRASVPEDTVIVGDPNHPARFLSADRCTQNDGHWAVDPDPPFSDGWHGAPVVSDADGAVIGMLLKEGDTVRIALFDGGPFSGGKGGIARQVR